MKWRRKVAGLFNGVFVEMYTSGVMILSICEIATVARQEFGSSWSTEYQEADDKMVITDLARLDI